MRTLFLIFILGALIVIALKEPGQTTADVIEKLNAGGRSVAADLTASLTSAGEQDSASEPSSPAVIDLLQQENTAQSLSLNEANNGLPSNTDANLTSEPREEIDERLEHQYSGSESWRDLPILEPLEEVDVDEVPTHFPVETTEGQVQPVSPQVSYADVKAYYESASRLLSSMQ